MVPRTRIQLGTERIERLRMASAHINPSDFPREWLGWPLTVEVEAKAKELAVARLLADLTKT